MVITMFYTKKWLFLAWRKEIKLGKNKKLLYATCETAKPKQAVTRLGDG